MEIIENSVEREIEPFVEVVDEKCQQFLFETVGRNKLKLTERMIGLSPSGPVYDIDLKQFTSEQIEKICGFLASFNKLNIEIIKNDFKKNGFFIPCSLCLMRNISEKQIRTFRKTYQDRTSLVNDRLIPIIQDELEIYWVSLMIICSMLGEKWHEDNIKNARRKNENRMNYLLTDQKNQIELQSHVFRTVLFADCLFALQYVNGFEVKLKQLRELSPSKPDVTAEDYIIELLLAKMILDEGHQITFRKPSNKPKEDYDLDIILKNGIPLCAELKCRRQNASIDINKLKNKIYRASGQLPESGKSIIIIKIQKKLISIRNFQNEIEVFLDLFYRKHSHVIAVIMVWEESLLLLGGGSANFIKHHTIMNRHQIFIEETYFRDIFKNIKPLKSIINQNSIEVSFGTF